MDNNAIENERVELEKEKQVNLLASLQRGYYLRIVAVVLFLGFGALAIKRNGPGFLYFLKFNSPPTDLGNARKLVASGHRFIDMPSNSYVKVEDLMITKPANTKVHKFFFSPLLDIVVRTKRPLDIPDLRPSRYPVPAGLVFLLQERKVEPEDFSTHFNAEGRLVKITEYPGWKGGLQKFYGSLLKGHENKAYILFDQDTPWSHVWDAVALFALAAGLLLSVFLVIRQRKLILKARTEYLRLS